MLVYLQNSYRYILKYLSNDVASPYVDYVTSIIRDKILVFEVLEEYPVRDQIDERPEIAKYNCRRLV